LGRGKYDQVPALLSNLVRRNVAVIATPGSAVASLAAKAATNTIPIVFGVAADPVQLGLVASLARPGGNATGINFLLGEVVAKRLRLLHDLVPKAVRIAVLVNPANPSMAEPTIQDVQEAAPALGLQVQVLRASTTAEIEGAFAGFAVTAPMRFSSLPTGSSAAVACSSLSWRRATEFQQLSRTLTKWRPVG
jgi:putative ABC transport system substrate-binding protein